MLLSARCLAASWCRVANASSRARPNLHRVVVLVHGVATGNRTQAVDCWLTLVGQVALLELAVSQSQSRNHERIQRRGSDQSSQNYDRHRALDFAARVTGTKG